MGFSNDDLRAYGAGVVPPPCAVTLREWMLRAALILILSLFASACHNTTRQEAGPPLSVRLAYVSSHAASLVQVAISRGFFNDEHLTVQPRRYNYGREALQAVLRGEADLGTVAETPFMFAALRGEKVSLVGSIFSASKSNVIVASGKTGIHIPLDLKGKRIGFTPGTTSHIFLSSFLTANRLGMEDFVPVPLSPGQMRDALLSGQVDAISLWSPSRNIIARELGADAVVFQDPYIFTETMVLAGLNGYLDQNQEVLRRVLRALLRAEEFAATHPEEARALVSAALDLDPELLAESWRESTFTVSLGHALLIALEEETRWAQKHNLAPHSLMPNYLEYIDPRPLLSVRGEAVDQQVIKRDLRP